MKLVFIEGPGKRDTIKKYLGSEYVVFPTKGHVRDLPAKSFAIDINNNFQPSYEIIAGKQQLVDQLKAQAKKADAIYLATDPDREGEAIAWHLATILNLDPNAPVRTAFNAISKKNILESIANPKPINQNLVNAQQGRRVLDRIMGYQLSPLLSKKIRGKLSAGRVQSVTLKLIVDREKAIQNFVPKEYWTITANLTKGGQDFKADLTMYKDKKIEVVNKEQVDQILQAVENAEYVVGEVKRQVSYSKPQPPYITSTMLQDAISKLKMTSNSATKVAQTLYEGVNIAGEGKTALVTYIRTDSTRVEPNAQFMAREYILNKYGKEYCPSKFNEFAAKANAQDAHEAIRPINLNYTPESLKGKIGDAELKLYTLIFNRFVASQMNYAQYDSLTVEISANDYIFKAGGKAVIFDGYQKLLKPQEEEKGINIPPLATGEKVEKKKIDSEQKFTKPPVRYNEATIAHEMEVKGIGRPSTYAATIQTLYNREYIKSEKRALVPTPLGVQVTEYLEEYFKNCMDIKFTADMEQSLDDVELGKVQWQDVVRKFYEDFSKQLVFASEQSGIAMPKPAPVVSDIKCDKCGAMMVYRDGKFGRFLACSNYPTCKNTKNIVKEPAKKVEETGICPKCGGVVAAKYSKNGKLFFGCNNYPKCDYISWDLPLEDICPQCGNKLFKKFSRGKQIIICNNKGCNYEKR